jgi:hypothetical protein
MSGPVLESVSTVVPPGTVQRKCGCHGACDSCRSEIDDKVVGSVRRQAKLGQQPAQSSPTPPAKATGTHGNGLAGAIRSAAQTGGVPLPAATRATMQERFGGRDFSSIRVHSGPSADALARSMHAEAFTVGNDIFFAGNRYDPSSASGQRLLAHELTHVAQQSHAGATVSQPKLEIGAADSAAEIEADRIAQAVTSGGVAGPIGSFPGATIRRADGASTPACNGPGCAIEPDGSNVCRCRSANVERVILPPSIPFLLSPDKAKDTDDFNHLLALYRARAAARSLQTVHGGRPVDQNTDTLWSTWGSGRTQERRDAVEAANLRDKCSPDHVIELQVMGTDSADNLRLLDRGRNTRSGRELSQWLARLNNTYFQERYPDNKILEFTAVQAGGSEAYSGAFAPDPCLDVDAQGGRAAGAGQSEKQVPEFVAGGQATHVAYANTSARTVATRSKAAVAALDLKTVDQDEVGFVANVGPKVRRLPFLTNRGNFADFPLVILPGSPRTLRFDDAEKRATELRLHFPGMSDAVLTSRLEHGEWMAEGDFTPTLFLLRYTTMHLEVRRESLSATLRVTPDRIRQALPIPGLTVDPVTLTLAIVDGTFSAAGLLGFKYGNLMTGSLSARWENDALLGDGTLDLHIPGIDKAQGQVHLRDGRFTGSVQVRKDKLKMPGVRDANFTAAIDENGLMSGSGTVGLEIPGLQHPTLLFTCDSQGNYAIAGTASAAIPGVRDPRIDISYANGAFSGRGRADFAIPGLDNAAIDLVYANGQFSGSAAVDFRKGKLGGHLQINLSPAHRLSGAGDLQYEIAPGLVAIVGMQIREDGSTHVQGELRLPDPIEIFPTKEFNKRLFGVSIDIPIFGISFGSTSVGVIANLSAALDARAGIGPGQIRHSRIIAAFDPMKDLAGATFQASAELYVPAHAEIAVVLSGGIGVSLLIVKALGGVSATGEVGLVGALAIPIDLKYVAGKFSVTGAAELLAQPRLRFHLDAFIKVQADLLVTTIDVYTKNWRLAAFEWGSGFQIGLRFPVHYAFGEPFNLSLNQIEFVAPQIDARKLVTDLLPK